MEDRHHRFITSEYLAIFGEPSPVVISYLTCLKTPFSMSKRYEIHAVSAVYSFNIFQAPNVLALVLGTGDSSVTKTKSPTLPLMGGRGVQLNREVTVWWMVTEQESTEGMPRTRDGE